MKRIGTTSLVLAALVSSGYFGLTACSVDTRSLGGEADSENVGEVGLKLTLPSGSQLNSVSYTITGPNAFSKTASVDITNSSTLSFQLSLPAGGPYSVTLTGTTTDGGTTCAGAGRERRRTRSAPVPCHSGSR